MVALKRGRSARMAGCGSMKQERRGGIETPLLPPGAGRPGAKQERRGGIETNTA